MERLPKEYTPKGASKVIAFFTLTFIVDACPDMSVGKEQTAIQMCWNDDDTDLCQLPDRIHST